MKSHVPDAVHRYLTRRGLEIRDELGAGIEGTVFATTSQTAIKVHMHQAAYQREKEIYLRLRDRGVETVKGFHVPQLIDFDDEALIIEMDHVTPPFVVDFAQASFTPPPSLTEEEQEEAFEEWNANGRSIFRKHWETVQSILSGFRCHGIYLSDIHPRNIDFGDGWQYEDDDD